MKFFFGHLILVSMIFSTCLAETNSESYKPMRGLGVATHMYGWDETKLIPIMKDLGMEFCRDSVSWHCVEKEKGALKIPEKCDRFVKNITGAGIKMIIGLWYYNDLYENPHDPEAYARYCKFVANHFKENKNILAYEIYNEPMGWFRTKQYKDEPFNGKNDAQWIAKFSEYMAAGAKGIREFDKTTPIISGGGVPPATYYMMKRFPKAFVNIDGITEHPYSFRLPPETVPWGGKKILIRDGVSVADDDHSMSSLIAHIGKESKEFLGRKLPVWVTEVGFSNYYDQKRPAMDRGFTKETQAKYLARSLINGLASGAKVWCIYNLMDTADNKFNSNYNFGLVEHSSKGYKPKPAYYVIRRISRLLQNDWRYIKKINSRLEVITAKRKQDDAWQAPVTDPYVKVDGLMTYWFEVPDGYITFIWKAGRYFGEFNPPFGNLIWVDSPKIKKIEVTNIITGESVETDVIRKDSRIKVQNIPVGSEVIAVKWIVDKK